MALRRGLVSVGAAVACCALTAACTSEPAPAATPSPTSPAATPSESQIERQMRLDYEAAEKAYRATSAEQDRLYQAGGASQATCELKATATGVVSSDNSLQALRRHHEGGLARERELPRSSASFAMVDGRTNEFG